MTSHIGQMVRQILFLGLIASFAAAALPGYYVNGRFLYDPCGQKTILIGVNAMIVYWDRDGSKDYPEIAKTGANCCRIM